MTTNTPHVYKGDCSGIIKFKSGNQVNDIICYDKMVMITGMLLSMNLEKVIWQLILLALQ